MTSDGLVFLSALHLADSALPTGRSVHSNGLESWLASDPDAGEEAISELIASTILESAAPLDGVLVAHAHAAGDLTELIAIDRLATAYRPSRPAREASLSMGRRLARVVPLVAVGSSRLLDEYLAALDAGETDGHAAIVAGATASALGISRHHAVLMELRGLAVALVGAAVRLGRLRSMTAQSILAELSPTIALAASEAADATLDDLRSTSGELEIAALAHARARVKLFAT